MDFVGEGEDGKTWENGIKTCKISCIKKKQPTKMGRRSPRIIEIKAKINKWDLLKLRSFCTAKETINKMKRQPTDWEKIFANDVTDQGLVSKIFEQLMTPNSIKTNNPIRKREE